MAIPDYQTLMLPLLKVLADGREWSTRDLVQQLANEFRLTEEEREARLPSGQQSIVHNRVHWSKTYLKQAGLIEAPSRGFSRITFEGRSVLSANPAQINVRFLERFPSFVEFKKKTNRDKEPETTSKSSEEVSDSATPLEALTQSYAALREATIGELLSRLRSCSPAFFERTVMKLLLAMGYGGVTGDGQMTGKSGDGGIDGIIREDKLGLDVVCLQAKRWDGTVGRAVVQQFVGSMDYIRARKGVILTTSTFSKEAISFVDRIEGKKVVLIDGDRLAELMLSHNVGVITTQTFELKEVSNDFFDDDEG